MFLLSPSRLEYLLSITCYTNALKCTIMSLRASVPFSELASELCLEVKDVLGNLGRAEIISCFETFDRH